MVSIITSKQVSTPSAGYLRKGGRVGQVQLTVFKTGDEFWLLVQRPPIVNDKARASFRRMDEDLRRILYFQERRRRAAARKRLRK
jgi:hypothetical protein